MHNFSSAALPQQLVLGTLTKRVGNFIHVQNMPFPRVTLTQEKLLKSAGEKKKKK